MFSNSRAFGAPISAAFKIGAVTLTALALAACSGPNPGDAKSPEQPASSSAQEEGTTLEMAEAWAKSASQSDEHAMTGIFGQIHNPTAESITLVSATADVATMVELHETIIDANGSTVMQAVEGGFEIAAGETKTLEPGGDHVMLMGLTQDLIAGDQVEFTLTLSTGDVLEIAAEVRDFSGAKETYSHEETETPADGADHSNH